MPRNAEAAVEFSLRICRLYLRDLIDLGAIGASQEQIDQVEALCDAWNTEYNDCLIERKLELAIEELDLFWVFSLYPVMWE